MPRRAPLRLRTPVLLVSLLLGLGLGVACKDTGGGSQAPQSVEGSPSCPRALPRNGASCPRGEADFCIYRGGSQGDHVCACGRNGWGCAKK
jgi:hypothetical protein